MEREKEREKEREREKGERKREKEREREREEREREGASKGANCNANHFWPMLLSQFGVDVNQIRHVHWVCLYHVWRETERAQRHNCTTISLAQVGPSPLKSHLRSGPDLNESWTSSPLQTHPYVCHDCYRSHASRVVELQEQCEKKHNGM